MPWHVETLILDRVFDVQRPSLAGGRTITSDFSFEAQGRTMYGVNAPGMPSLAAGDRVSFVLQEAGNWQTVVGWHNHSTGEQALPVLRTLGGGLYRAVSLTVIVGTFYLSAERPGTRLLSGVFLALGLLLGVRLIRVAWRGRQAARLIASLGRSSSRR